MGSTRALIPRDGIINPLSDAEMTRFRVVCAGSDDSHVKYPAAVTDKPLGITREGNAAAEMPVAVEVPGQGGCLKMSGTCAKGDWLCPAVDGSGYGRKVPATVGAYWAVAVALEAAADGQEIGVVTFMPVLVGAQHANGQCGVPSFASDPTPVPAQIWYNSADGVLKFRDGSATRTIQAVLAMFLFAIGALLFAPQARATDKTVMIRSGSGAMLQKEATATDTVLIPGNVNIGGGNVVFTGATGALDLTGALGIVEGALTNSTVVTGDIKDGTITNADIDAAAGIAATKIGSGNVSAAEFEFLDDITSDVQAQLNARLTNATYNANSLVYAIVDDTPVVLEIAANQFPGRNSTGNISALAVTDAALSVLDDASTGDMRTTLGLAIGTNVQAYDADLDDLADGNLTYSKVGVPAVRAITQSIAFSDFTDDLAAAGHLDLGTQIPEDSIVLGWQFDVSTGFTGNVSATTTVGIAGGTSNFSADTNENAFGIAEIGSASAAATSWCNAATTVRVTIAADTDFTAISAGAGNISVYYLQTE